MNQHQHQLSAAPTVKHVWHMTHVKNLHSIFVQHNAILCKNEVHKLRVQYNNIAMQSVQERRNCTLAMGYSVHAYTPTYFTQKTPMMYTLKDQARQLILLKIDVTKLNQRDLVTANQNAASYDVQFFKGLRTDVIDWEIINAAYWTDYPNGSAKRAAELLVLGCIPTSAVVGAEVTSAKLGDKLQREYGLQTTLAPESFFYH